MRSCNPLNSPRRPPSPMRTIFAADKRMRSNTVYEISESFAILMIVKTELRCAMSVQPHKATLWIADACWSRVLKTISGWHSSGPPSYHNGEGMNKGSTRELNLFSIIVQEACRSSAPCAGDMTHSKPKAC